MGENAKLCYGCMEPLGEGEEVCSKCGYSNSEPSLPNYLTPGKVLNERYAVGKLLSFNGEGATYIAYDTVLGKKAVIREYMPDTLCQRLKDSALISVNRDNLAQYKTFMSEFTELNKIMSKMRTLTHICPAVDMFAENNTTYVVFDYIGGMTLADYLDAIGGTLTWEQIKKVFPPIFTTISLIHNEGIIHRGISPETIYVTESGDLKLTDFCVAAARTTNTELAPEMYEGYAAPEQYSSKNWQGTWTDVYAVSAVLYRMLTGKMPVDALSRIGNDTLVEPIKLNPDIPQHISDVIMDGMKVTGEMRIQTITELVTNLFEQTETEKNNTAARRETMSKEEKEVKTKKESNSRIRIPIIVFVAVLGILMIAAAVALTQLTSDGEEESNSQMMGSPTITLPEVTTTAAPVTTAPQNSSNEEEEIFVMPDFLGKNYELMKTSDTYKEWFVFSEESDYNEDYAKGEIYDQSIQPGSIITKGTEVKFKVSNGPKTAAVPDFFGKKINDYIVELDKLGIKYDIQYIPEEGFMNDYVTELSKETGETIDIEKGEILIVYVCKNPEGDGSQTTENSDGVNSDILLPNEDEF